MNRNKGGPVRAMLVRRKVWHACQFVVEEVHRDGAHTDSLGFLIANCWSLVRSSWRRSGGKTESTTDMALVVMVLARPSMVLTMPDMAERGQRVVVR
jgi:hypothetical protein